MFRRISEEHVETCPDLGRQPTSVSLPTTTLTPVARMISESFGPFRGVGAELPKAHAGLHSLRLRAHRKGIGLWCPARHDSREAVTHHPAA